MLAVIFSFLLSTSFLSSQDTGHNTPPTEWKTQQHPGLHKGTAREVLQTGNYTYVLLENGQENQWVAIPKTEILIGETYYYTQGILMPDFHSKEFNRTFSSVLLLERLSPEPKDVSKSASPKTYTASVKTEKIEVSFPQEAGVITIAQLWENRETYSGKVLRVRGKVTKFNADILGKNWIHIQDGTEFNGHFDLTATCEFNVPVGEVVILRGTLTLDKDFGYGYKYDILLEDAILSK